VLMRSGLATSTTVKNDFMANHSDRGLRRERMSNVSALSIRHEQFSKSRQILRSDGAKLFQKSSEL
jgi:hypothetical protein